MRMTLIGVFVIGTAACGGAKAVMVPGPAGGGQISVPASVLHRVEDRWKGATLAAQPTACTGQTDASAVPALKGDINGDGMDDLVLRMEKDGASRLYAALARVGDATHDVLEVSSGDAAKGPISMLRRGGTFRQDGLVVSEFLGSDTLVVTQCDGTRMAYFWTGTGFIPRLLARAAG
ncbi:MAG: hypothetical protein ABI051_14065 [Vicinamibacterales bacterium]